jgi:hypothetical protein
MHYRCLPCAVTRQLQSEQPNRDIETSKMLKISEVRCGRAMKHLILSFLLFMALCLPVLAGNGQGQNNNSQGGTRAAPGPVVGTGLPVIMAVGYGVYWLVRRRRRQIN